MKVKKQYVSYRPKLSSKTNSDIVNKELRLKELEEFLKNKIVGTKTCACNLCSYDREMYRLMQQVLRDYNKLRK